MPCRPATPRISPGQRSSETSSSCRLTAGRAPQAPASHCAAGGAVPLRKGGRERAADDQPITSSSLMSATAKLPIWRPLRSTVSRSQKRRTSGRRWEMKTTVVPRSRFRRCAAQPFDVAARQRRGRLVEQQDARLARDGAGDLDLLPDRQCAIADIDPRVQVAKFQTGQNPVHPFGGLRRSSTKPRWIGASGSSMLSATVRSGTRVISWKAVWMPSAWASRGAARWTGARRPKSSRVGPRQSAQHLDHRRLAGAVLAEQRMDLAGADLERDAVERHGRAEALAHSLHGQGVRGVLRLCHRRISTDAKRVAGRRRNRRPGTANLLLGLRLADHAPP